MGNWIVAAAIGFVSIICIRYLVVWLRYRGERVITCPENCRPAGVALEAGTSCDFGFVSSFFVFPLARTRRMRPGLPRRSRGISGGVSRPQHPDELVSG